MTVPELSARVTQLETRLAELATERTTDRKMLEKLRKALDLDGATGAFSRIYFETQLGSELRRWRRDHHDRLAVPLSIGLVDLDHLKRINDGNGHLAGDRALKEIVTICRLHLRRDTDVVARYGGDEFALLFPQTPIESAAHLAEQIRRDVSAAQVKGQPISVSIGLSTCPTHGRSARALLDAADRALYRAKQSRNTVACAE